MGEIICNTHGIALDLSAGCHACLAEWDALPDPNTMTGHQRREELDRHCKQLTVPFPMVHKRIEALVGRPVYTHEIGLNYEGLQAEAEGPRPEAIRSN